VSLVQRQREELAVQVDLLARVLGLGALAGLAVVPWAVGLHSPIRQIGPLSLESAELAAYLALEVRVELEARNHWQVEDHSSLP
jgi:hypothetical protein